MNKQTKKKFKKQGVVTSLLAATILFSNAIPYANAQGIEVSNNDIIVTPINTQSEDVIKGEYVIVFKEGASISEMEAEIKKYKGIVVKEHFDLNMVTVSLTKSKYNQLINNSEIISVVEPNLSFEKVGGLDQYTHNLTNVESAWNNQYTGKGIDIAVIDSGISLNHSDIKVVGGISTVDYTSSYNDDNGHGTHVAGIIGSLKNNTGTVGVAYDANLYAVKAMNKEGKGSLADIIAGLNWAIDQNVDIINLSIGTDQYSVTFHNLIKEATEKGIMVVAASGNDGTNTINYPAKFPEVIAVGAVDQNKTIADFSNFGSEIDIVAPGINVKSTYMNGYATSDGTSTAAPQVAGLLALYKNAYPHLSSSEIEQLLYANAEDLGTSGFDEYFGHGLARFSQSTPPTEVTPPVDEETPPTEVTPPVGEETPPTEVTPPVGEETPPTEVTPPVDEETPPTEVILPIENENSIILPNGVSLNKNTHELEWQDLNALRYQVSFEKVTAEEAKKGQITLSSKSYDLDRFKLEDNSEYHLTITPRLYIGYSAEHSIKLKLTTINGQYVISIMDRTDDVLQQPEATNSLVELENGITINTKTGELTWQPFENDLRYRLELATPNEKKRTVFVKNAGYSSLSRMYLTENTEYIAHITPYINGYDTDMTIKAKVKYVQGEFSISEI